MIKYKNKGHSTDIFFVLCIFLIFAVVLSSLLIIGIKTYEGIHAETEQNYELRTGILYIENKIHSCNEEGKIETERFGDSDAIILSETDDFGNEYVTRLYCYNGSLMELYTEKDNILDPVAGNEIADMEYMNIDNSDDDILKITVKNANGKERTIAVSTVGQGELYAD